MPEKSIVFFDGVCGLCNTMVDFFIQKDKKRQLLFAPMQGKTAKGILTKTEIDQLDSFVLYEKGIKYYRSDAALKTFGKLPGGWKLLSLFNVIPRFLRDPFYRLIAKNRYKWFGKKSTCRMPTSAERGVLLD